MKILCICEHGNVRSVALAYLIKTIYKHEAIAIGWKNVSKETKEMLFNWADKIIYLDYNVPGKLNNKEFQLNVGEDIWHDPYHQGLQHKLLKRLKELNL